MGIFPDAQGQVTLHYMVRSGQITCKNEEDPIKHEGARVKCRNPVANLQKKKQWFISPM